MATLEKIRSKSAILFTVIILALLAFILGDFFNSSRSLTGPGNTAAKVGGQKIDIHEFNQRVEERRQAMQQQAEAYGQSPDIDIANLQTQVMNEMIFEALLNEGIDKMGIKVTDKELEKAMGRNNPLPFVVQMAQAYGFESPAQFYDVVSNPQQFGLQPEQAAQLKNAWVEFTNSVRKNMLQQKYMSLLQGVLATNNLDARSFYDENASTSKIAYARLPLSTLNDSTVTVSSEELRALYEERKGRYALVEETRPIDYIQVRIEPSKEDQLKAQKAVEDALQGLKTQDGIEAVDGSAEFVVVRNGAPLNGLPAEVKGRIDSLKTAKVLMLSQTPTRYSIAKLIDTYTDVDTVKIDQLVILGNAAKRDSVLKLVEGGANIDSLIAKNLIAQKQVDQKVYVPSAGALAETLKTAALNQYVIPETAVGENGGQEYGIALKVTQRAEPVTFYDVALITYDVDPSTATINKMKSDLQAFVNANNTPELFAENAAKAGYHVRPDKITPSSVRVSDVKNSRGAAKWVMNAKKGEVSDVFGGKESGSFIVMAVKDIYKGDYVPATDPDLGRELTSIARNRKKGDKLVAEYSGKAKDLQGYSTLMKAQVDTTEVTFGQNNVKGIMGPASKLIAKTSAAKPGTLIQPFATDDAVYVVQVISVDKNPIEFDPVNDANIFSQKMGSMRLLNGPNLFNILLGRNKITNNLQKFYND